MLIVGFFAFILTSIAFSSYTQKLSIEGKATIEGRIYELVRIQKVTIHETSGNAVSLYYGHTDTEFMANVSADNGSYIIYKIDLINESPYNAYVTSSDILSFVNSSGSNSSNHTYEIIDLIESTTVIPMHGTYSFYVKISGTGSGDPLVNFKSEFEYSLYKYFDFTLTSIPSDATITLETTEGTYTSVGSITHRVEEGTTVSWTISKQYYYTNEDSYVMPYGNQNKTITLEEDPHRTITVETTPSNATITLTYTDGTPIQPLDSTGKKFSITKDTTFNYTISAPEYYDLTGQYSISQDETVSVTLTELPWITGTFTNTSRTVANTKTDTNNHSGYYLIELWGGSGGYGGGVDGGTAGYVYGVLYLSSGTSVYYTLGGNGEKGESMPGGANGGGVSGTDNAQLGGSGGGYSAFVVGTNNITLDTISSGNVKLIAAGGGGAGGYGGMAGSYKGGAGGAAGTIFVTGTSVTGGTAFAGTNGSTGSRKGEGYAGTTTGGGSNDGGNSGAFLTGGDAKARGGGGGAGYYGGGGGGGYRTPFSGADYGPAGGGGGSSFVSSTITWEGLSNTITNQLKGATLNPSTTGGAIVITYIGKSL